MRKIYISIMNVDPVAQDAKKVFHFIIYLQLLSKSCSVLEVDLTLGYGFALD